MHEFLVSLAGCLSVFFSSSPFFIPSCDLLYGLGFCYWEFARRLCFLIMGFGLLGLINGFAGLKVASGALKRCPVVATVGILTSDKREIKHLLCLTIVPSMQL